MRAEVAEELRWIFATWLARGRDPTGNFPAFVTRYFDAVTGEFLSPIAGGLFPLFSFLLDALEVRDEPDAPEWRAALAAFLDTYFEHGLHPATGLPRRWDAARSTPLDGQPLEIATDLEFLLDVSERGSEDWRPRALAAAKRMAETVLARGVLPDGTVAASYRPSDGEPFTDVPPLRRLDVPAQLARLGAATSDGRMIRVAESALGEFEFTNLWHGSWNEIDPGFDDEYGNYAARALRMSVSEPSVEHFAAVIESGYAYFAPLWREALRAGGSVAADQVRCWDLLTEWARTRGEPVPALRELVSAAARAHFKGEQYGNGAWGDVTFFQYDPKTGIEVGDLPGTPSNLLLGLSIAMQEAAGEEREDLRAMFLAVLRSTREHYRRPHGYLLTQREHRDVNGAGGGLRIAEALIRMLRML
jgi:hypothetical protein